MRRKQRKQRILMEKGKWLLLPGESVPNLPDPPPDPRTYEERLALNGTLPPARIKEVMSDPPTGDSPANKTRLKYQESGKCQRCGQTRMLVTKTSCAECAEKHRKVTQALKKRLAAHGLCVNCGQKNTTSTLKCEACTTKHYKKHHAYQGKH
jgi:hypothetical protein